MTSILLLCLALGWNVLAQTKPNVTSNDEVSVCAVPMDDTCMIVEKNPKTSGPKLTLNRVDEVTCVLDCPNGFTANCPENPKSKVDTSICIHKPLKIRKVLCECVKKM